MTALLNKRSRLSQIFGATHRFYFRGAPSFSVSEELPFGLKQGGSVILTDGAFDHALGGKVYTDPLPPAEIRLGTVPHGVGLEMFRDELLRPENHMHAASWKALAGFLAVSTEPLVRQAAVAGIKGCSVTDRDRPPQFMRIYLDMKATQRTLVLSGDGHGFMTGHFVCWLEPPD